MPFRVGERFRDLCGSQKQANGPDVHGSILLRASYAVNEIRSMLDELYAHAWPIHPLLGTG